ncbi:MAG TPA: uracil-DNA glycosylase [Terriglobales bacterium]|nr:uracil-DNA glycosylase [Terriglobales bacterium]
MSEGDASSSPGAAAVARRRGGTAAGGRRPAEPHPAASRSLLFDYLEFQRELGIETLRWPRGALDSLPSAPPPAAAGQTAAAAPSADPAAALAAIRADLGDCTRCPLHSQGRKQIVFGDGNPRAELVFVGEAPGADEDRQGVPFVGRAGQLLNDMIQKGMGLERSQVYICNVVKCRPPENRTPEPNECATCSPFLFRQLAAIRPRLIIALGSVAAQNLLHYRGSLASVRGRLHDISIGDFATKLVVTYHPAYLLRDPTQKKAAWQDLQMAMSYLGLRRPSR